MATSDQEQCTYLVRVKTGDSSDAGTDSNISLKVTSSCGKTVPINNLIDWGIMDDDHEYFKGSNLDFFMGRDTYLKGNTITVTSDGQGNRPRWYCKFVKITAIRSGEPTTETFEVNQWLEPNHLSVTVGVSPV